ncbi:conjugative transposon protein TraM [Pedobacter aquatilis]|uniref:conjugative transposon protein TraM n=1 Tax=Pedobacter aquatilis TaxID=351343 RepID=UPI00292ED122|nr:conjugative transposon protein TraM [Pedobacter aquatilis]
MKKEWLNWKGVFGNGEDGKRKLSKPKAVLLLVLVLLLCICGLLYVFKDEILASEKQQGQKGINASLPDAVLKKDAPEDKMSIYSVMPMDSTVDKNADLGITFGERNADDQAEAIKEKLLQINAQVSAPATRGADLGVKVGGAYGSGGSSNMKSDVDRLELLMKSMQKGDGEDKEMQQLGEVMDKIISIQNPGVVQQKLLERKAEMAAKDSAFHALPAVVDGFQKVAQGGLVRLKLMDTATLSGMLLAKGQLLYGSCSIVNQRLLLNITNVRLGSSIIPVNLSVFSLDGIMGIDAPDAVLGEVAADGTVNALGSMQLLSMDNSLGVQAASAGIDAAKNLIGRKVKRVRVKLRDGLPVLLKVNRF